MRRTYLCLFLAACSEDPWPGVWANGEPFAECAPVASQARCEPTGRTFALAVCGDLEANNTLAVRAPHADVALWVRDGARTSAPLTVEGNYWSQRNEATNTQSITGTATTGAQSAACSHDLPNRAKRDWNVRIVEPTNVTLEGCSYAQPSLEVDNTLEVRIRGDVAWVIESDLRIAAPLVIVVEPGGNLEWTIAGALEVDNTLTIAGPTRLNVGGPIRIAAPLRLDGSLVAPQSRVEADNTVDVTGSAYVGSLRVAAPMRVGGASLLAENACALEREPPPR